MITGTWFHDPRPIKHEPGTYWCQTCRAHTRWTPMRGGKREKCSGCGEIFPCAHECRHADCRDARAQKE